MEKLDQILPTSRGLSEGRVGRENFNRKVDLVDNALAGPVATVEQLKVFVPIVRPYPVDVVNSFFGQELATESFGHDVTVLHDSALLALYETRDGYPDVAVTFGVAPERAAFEFPQRSLSEKFVTALRRAVFLLRVKAPARLPTASERVLAVGARKLVAIFGIFGASDVGTRSRAVKRSVWVLFEVGIIVGAHHAERLGALLAREVEHFSSRSNVRSTKSFGTPAGNTAKTALVARVAVKRLSTILTLFLDRHCSVLSRGCEVTMHASIQNVK